MGTELFTFAHIFCPIYPLDCYITEKVDLLLAEIPQRLNVFGAILLEESEPPLAIGKHCDNPNPCPFTKYCWQHVPDISIFTIPRLGWEKKEALIEQGILAIADLPSDYALSSNQRTYADSVLTRQPVIDEGAIADSLSRLEYPIHFFDFEAQNPAIPRFDGLKPYEQFPFQYSCHVLQTDGSVEHREYLHSDPSDPRPSLITALTTDIASTGSVVVYHKSFEATLLRKLATDFPEYALKLGAIADSLWDLEDIFKHHYKHPDFKGSTSIKNVLPALVPSLSYKTLSVQRGDQAQAVWEEMLICSDELRKSQLIRGLKEYCKLDTLAMVEIFKQLTQFQQD